ncbi:calcineurin-like phosphoesterase family protein [Chlamydia ibidis]|uniref:Calcineurin-like phosphoesterase family protein n=2 Tax=Chlamydia ibidis TaxID=1405396 RepID=S7J3H4_9CHLA|nr:metallophosphoesterase [Chlamydia ibidis]EPP34738.1 calcineurin-like phosphoesterase family protein [Chlamydia ibidis]EQM62971.1 calcineurin-like phosphoesterase family protein [Chlamydia ibidis 10-1398/6]
MQIYGLADLHLALGIPEKSMEIFGDPWTNYHQKIYDHWTAKVRDDDYVLLAGDISWAMDIEDAKKDFDFLSSLPGTKIMIRGNHDYWSSASTRKLSTVLAKNIRYLSQGYTVLDANIAVVGVRLWEHPTICIDSRVFASSKNIKHKIHTEHDEKIFLREQMRLQRALDAITDDIQEIIVITHYPPISSDGSSGPISEMLERNGRVRKCLFGHLHKVQKPLQGFGCIRGIEYSLIAADYLDFVPKVVM